MNFKNFFGYSLSIVLTGVAIEVICLLAVKSEFIGSTVPSYSLQYSPVWLADINPHFGVWHPSSINYRNSKSCFEVIGQTNSYGAVDPERKKKSEQSRTVVLGDSFVEGYGVEIGKRFTDILENETGRPFLNFGTSGNFGPTQYHLLYKHLASGFDHDEVLVVILPDNDFLDEYPREGRYQPYLKGNYPDYTVDYTLDNMEESYAFYSNPSKRSLLAVFREYSFALNVAYWAISKGNTQKEPAGKELSSYSGYYDYEKGELLKLRYNLEKIKEIAGEREMKVVTIPRLIDFYRFKKEGHNRLAEDLRRIGEVVQFEYYDLLPELMTGYSGRWEALFHTCDGHWAEEGHRAAANYIKRKVRMSSSTIK